MHTSPVANVLSSLELGSEIVFKNLVMYPLLTGGRPSSGSVPYWLLDDAMNLKAVVITEVSEEGRVPELGVTNGLGDAVLIVDGEELLGAKQNRIVNTTILVPPMADLVIPVSCVEAGRWRLRSEAFTPSPRVQYASGRAKRTAQVTASMACTGKARSDQQAVWADIAEMSAKLQTYSSTGAMSNLFDQHHEFIDQCVAACGAVTRQVGALFAVNGRIVQLDVFGYAGVLRRFLPKLVRGVAIDALEALRRNEGADESKLRGWATGTSVAARRFLESVGAASAHTADPIGLGQAYRLTARGLAGSALMFERELVHLSAFSVS